MADTADFEKMEFDGWGNPDIASGYADGFAYATTLVAKELANEVSAGPEMQILDLCTGHGVVAARLVPRGAAVTGLDFSDAMIFAMAFPNLLGCYFLLPVVKKELNEYWDDYKSGRLVKTKN